MIHMLFSIIAAFFLSVTGCAINDRGMVSVRFFENESSYLLTLESWGGYLSTRQADGGLTLGHAERIFIYPKPGNKSALSIDELLQQSTGGFDKEIAARDFKLKDKQPYAWIEKNQGIMFHANPLKTGLSAGMESRRVIRMPKDFDGIFLFSYHEDGRIEAAIKDTSKNK
ncbi:MAG: hypothetical protein ACXWTS_05935 [Methylococcaceae bacterium]